MTTRICKDCSEFLSNEKREVGISLRRVVYANDAQGKTVCHTAEQIAVRPVGNCLTRILMKTLCGLELAYDQDSSD